jgi:carboxylate-amine ligase
MYEYIRFVDPAVDMLDSRQEINYIYKILEEGTSADRQLRVYNQSGQDLKAVVDYLVKDTMERCGESTTS